MDDISQWSLGPRISLASKKRVSRPPYFRFWFHTRPGRGQFRRVQTPHTARLLRGDPANGVVSVVFVGTKGVVELLSTPPRQSSTRDRQNRPRTYFRVHRRRRRLRWFTPETLGTCMASWSRRSFGSLHRLLVNPPYKRGRGCAFVGLHTLMSLAPQGRLPTNLRVAQKLPVSKSSEPKYLVFLFTRQTKTGSLRESIGRGQGSSANCL